MRALVQPAEAPDARGARLVAAMPSRAQACEGGQQGCWLERRAPCPRCRHALPLLLPLPSRRLARLLPSVTPDRAPREAIIPHHRGIWGARVCMHLHQ
jgi:hypothetical protein